MNNLNYRLDHRTIDQFTNDIRIGHQKEHDIITCYAQYVYAVFGMELSIENNGIDNSGKFIAGRVNSKADYLVNGEPLEIKFNNKMLNFFHFKVSQLDSYIEQDAHVLFVNGYETSNPVFTIMSPVHLKELKQLRKPFYFRKWMKDVIRLYSDDYMWKELRGYEGRCRPMKII